MMASRRLILAGLPLAATMLVPVARAQQPAAQLPAPQQVEQRVPASPTAPSLPDVPAISAYTPPVATTATGTPPLLPLRSNPTGLDARHYFWAVQAGKGSAAVRRQWRPAAVACA